MKNVTLRLVIAGILLIPIVFAVIVPLAFAQDPTAEPTLEPIPTLPDVPPTLPDELPADPLELAPILELFILWGACLLAKHLTDVSKVIPGVGNNQKFRKQIVRAVAAVAVVVVTFVGFWFEQVAGFLYDNGIWAAILALLSGTWLAHRADKLLRQIGARLIKQLHT
jgi:hypothetical protein